jgi:hypothetical protein
MRKFATLLAVVVLTVFSAGVLVAATAPGTVTIKNVQKMKAPVVFPHKAHAERIKNCEFCHHKDKPGHEVSCFACHKAEKKGAVISFKDAMHERCKGCHQKEKKGPTACNACHKK